MKDNLVSVGSFTTFYSFPPPGLVLRRDRFRRLTSYLAWMVTEVSRSELSIVEKTCNSGNFLKVGVWRLRTCDLSLSCLSQ